MLSTLPSLPAVSTPPAAPPQASPAPAEHSEESRAFARQLQEAQRQDDRGETAHTQAQAQKTDTATQKAASPKAPSRTHRTPTEAAETTPRKAASKAEAGAAGTAETTTPGDAVNSDTTTADETGPQDLAALLAHLRGHSPVAAETPAAAAAAAEAGTETLTKGGKGGKAGKAGSNPTADGAPGLDATGSRPQALAAAQTGAPPVVQSRDAGTQFKEQLAAAQVQPQAQPASLADSAAKLPDASTFSAALAAAASAAATAPGAPVHGSAAAPAQAQLAATPGGPDFAPQLGTQITTFVRDGVQHAQLHLNPADMGPVTVQIQLDGQGAQVHLLADQALTRQALEQAMPDLAGSLREAGLTLTGGGVFQQPRQAGGDAGGQDKPGSRSRGGVTALAGSSSNSADNGPDSTARGVSAMRRRGVVDLVA